MRLRRNRRKKGSAGPPRPARRSPELSAAVRRASRAATTKKNKKNRLKRRIREKFLGLPGSVDDVFAEFPESAGDALAEFASAPCADLDRIKQTDGWKLKDDDGCSTADETFLAMWNTALAGCDLPPLKGSSCDYEIDGEPLGEDCCEKAGMSGFAIFVILLLVLGVCGGVAWYFYKKKQQP